MDQAVRHILARRQVQEGWWFVLMIPNIAMFLEAIWHTIVPTLSYSHKQLSTSSSPVITIFFRSKWASGAYPSARQGGVQGKIHP